MDDKSELDPEQDPLNRSVDWDDESAGETPEAAPAQEPQFEATPVHEPQDAPVEHGDVPINGPLDAPYDFSKDAPGTPRLAKSLGIDEPPPPTRHEARQEELRKRQETRIDTRNAQKREGTDPASQLAAIKERAKRGETSVLPSEYRDDVPSPFTSPANVRNMDPTIGKPPVGSPNMGSPNQSQPQTSFPTPEDRRRIERQAESIAPPSAFPDSQNPIGGNPFESGSQEVVNTLKEILKVLQSIDQKLPQSGTYTE